VAVAATSKVGLAGTTEESAGAATGSGGPAPALTRLAGAAGGSGGMPVAVAAPAEALADSMFVSASTCFHQVKLPEYTSAAVLRRQLLHSIYASGDVVDMT